METKRSHNIVDTLCEMATEAMLYEVSCYPAFGLVSPISSGAHDDMDYYTFMKSTSVLIKYMNAFAKEGYSNKTSKEIFNAIRKIGIEAEKDMFKKTSGINTHKGMIFLMGISCAAVSKAIHDKMKFGDIRKIIQSMTEGLVSSELKKIDKKKKLTYGEKLYLKYGCEGIRGEVERGIPVVFEHSLGIYESMEHLNLNDRLVHTLLAIMEKAEDSTILHRHEIETLKYVQKRAGEILKIGGTSTEEGKISIEDLDKEFTEKKISPGGSADLLAVTVFMSLVKKFIWNIGEKNV